MEAHFGLLNATNIETLRIEWPSGTVQEFSNVAANQFKKVTEPAPFWGHPPMVHRKSPSKADVGRSSAAGALDRESPV